MPTIPPKLWCFWKLLLPTNWVSRHNSSWGLAPRGVITGPGYASLDLGLAKFTPISERLNLEFRAESFNLLNRPNFDLPNRQFGTQTFGEIFSANDPRELQFALKLHF